MSAAFERLKAAQQRAAGVPNPGTSVASSPAAQRGPPASQAIASHQPKAPARWAANPKPDDALKIARLTAILHYCSGYSKFSNEDQQEILLDVRSHPDTTKLDSALECFEGIAQHVRLMTDDDYLRDAIISADPELRDFYAENGIFSNSPTSSPRP
jgi:hypothetical protein